MTWEQAPDFIATRYATNTITTNHLHFPSRRALESIYILSKLTISPSNHGTAIKLSEVTVLAQSSEYGYLDHNRNQELNTEETLTSYPIITVEEIGDGEVSDPSIFINVMLERPGNQKFANRLFGPHEQVLFDTSPSTSPHHLS